MSSPVLPVARATRDRASAWRLPALTLEAGLVYVAAVSPNCASAAVTAVAATSSARPSLTGQRLRDQIILVRLHLVDQAAGGFRILLIDGIRAGVRARLEQLLEQSRR